MLPHIINRTDQFADPRLLRAFWPSSVAVVGATEDIHKVGGRPLHYLQRFGFPGAIYPINPRRDIVQGLKTYASLMDLPEVPEVAIVAVAQNLVIDVVRQCGAAGVGTVIVMSSGFGETGEKGQELQRQLSKAAADGGVRLIGPNAQGIANFASGAVLNFSTMFLEVKPADGAVAIVSQSGAASAMLYAMLRDRGVGVRYLCASGNDADTTVSELATVAARDPEVRVVLLYLESLSDPAQLARMAHVARNRDVAVVAVKAGRSQRGARAAASHTGALVSDDSVVGAFLERHGIWRAQDMHELINAVELQLKPVQVTGERLVIMSHSGAVGVLCADTAESLELPLTELSQSTIDSLAKIMPGFGTAQNPIDLTGALMTQSSMYRDTLDALARDPQADLFFIGIPVAGPGYDVSGMAQATADFILRTSKPTVVSAPQVNVRAIFRAAGVATFERETDALMALRQLVRHEHLRNRAQELIALHELPQRPAGAASSHAGSNMLSEAESLSLLKDAGVPVVEYQLCSSEEAAVAAWKALGPEVVVKACSAHMPHKSGHGLVYIGLRDEASVRAAWQDCLGKIAALEVPAEGVIVARRIRGQREFALGLRQDRLFGTTVMISDGGKYVEALGDFVALAWPFDTRAVIEAVPRLRIAPILAGVRGEPPVDLQALAEIAVALGQFGSAHVDDIASVDLNPIIVGAAGQGALAVDAIVECTRATQ